METRYTHRSIMSGSLICVLVLLHGPVVGASEDDEIANLITSISRQAKQRVKFHEKKYSDAFSEPVSISGVLEHERGKYFIKRVTTPFQRSYEIHGETLILRKADKISRQISINDYPAMRGMFEALRSSFAGDLQTLKKYYRITLSREKHIWTLHFTPKHSGIIRFIDRISISGSGTRVLRIVTQESAGDRSELTIEDSND